VNPGPHLENCASEHPEGLWIAWSIAGRSTSAIRPGPVVPVDQSGPPDDAVELYQVRWSPFAEQSVVPQTRWSPNGMTPAQRSSGRRLLRADHSPTTCGHDVGCERSAVARYRSTASPSQRAPPRRMDREQKKSGASGPGNRWPPRS